jgi:hypothetical protein
MSFPTTPRNAGSSPSERPRGMRCSTKSQATLLFQEKEVRRSLGVENAKSDAHDQLSRAA